MTKQYMIETLVNAGYIIKKMDKRGWIYYPRIRI